MVIGSILGPAGQTPTTPSDPASQTGSGTQQGSGAETKPVEPASENTSADNSGADGGGAAEKSSNQQAEAAAGRQSTANPDTAPQKAEPRSVVNAIATDGSKDVSRAREAAAFNQEQARTQALIDSVAVVQGQSPLLDQPKKVDRYAPPDLLPASEVPNKAPASAAAPPASRTGG